MARAHLDFASSPQVRRAADSLYYRQYAFLKLPPHEVQKIADVKDTLSHNEFLERQGLQQFPEGTVRHFKPGEHQDFLSGSQNPAWVDVGIIALYWQRMPPLGMHAYCAGHRLLVYWSILLCTYLMRLPCPHTLGSQQTSTVEGLQVESLLPFSLTKMWQSTSV